MKNQRLKQFAASFLIVLSLFASSITACACSHRQETPDENSASCREHSPEGKVENHQNHNSPENLQAVISETECCCIQPARKVFAKSETVKIEKQILVLNQFQPIEIVFVPQTLSVESAFSAPFYLTDSFYNLAPGRAPPRL